MAQKLHMVQMDRDKFALATSAESQGHQPLPYTGYVWSSLTICYILATDLTSDFTQFQLLKKVKRKKVTLDVNSWKESGNNFA